MSDGISDIKRDFDPSPINEEVYRDTYDAMLQVILLESMGSAFDFDDPSIVKSISKALKDLSVDILEKYKDVINDG
tara:strand:- start:79 stop:306 length:228 start_codon:yes stop_codon:yes gene_type:complete